MNMKKLNAATKRYVSSHDNPRDEVRELVRRHAAITKTAISLANQSSDRVIREGERKGERIPCSLSEDVQRAVAATAKAAAKDAAKLKPLIERALRQVPIYDLYLRHVYGMGPMTAGYIVALIDIHKAPRPSNLVRYCGNSVDSATGRMERRCGAPKAIGGTGTFNPEMRKRLWQFGASLMKNHVKISAKAPHGVTSKYLDIWRDTTIREHERKAAGTQANATTRPIAKGRMRMVDVFLYDLYLIWRASEGLDVWPCWYQATVTGRPHGNPEGVVVNAPETWTLAQAIEFVGYVGSRPNAHPVRRFKDLATPEEIAAIEADDDEESAAAAE